MTEKRFSFLLTCLDAPSVHVSFEPDGADHVLNMSDWFRIEIVGPEDGEPEISYSPGWIIVGAWSHAETRAWDRTGQELRL